MNEEQNLDTSFSTRTAAFDLLKNCAYDHYMTETNQKWKLYTEYVQRNVAA